MAEFRRLYHFVDARYGLDDIRRKRIKISELKDLNDPFELLAIDLSRRDHRWALEATRKQLSEVSGMLCFSSKWSNPVVWSHYADRHRGLCLEFEVPSAVCVDVRYAGRRLASEAEQLNDPTQLNQEFVMKLLTTKYASWKYENEVRVFTSLRDRDADSGRVFKEFDDDLRLTKVIIGARSDVSRAQVASALRGYRHTVESFMARLAFKSFRIVRQKRETVWK